MVHIHAEGPAFFCWIPKLFGKRVICTIHGLDWAREKWKFGVGSKFIRQGEKSAVKYADEIIVLSKGVQKYFMETYGRGDMRLRKTQLSFHLKKMNGNGSQGGKNLEYGYCSIEILC